MERLSAIGRLPGASVAAACVTVLIAIQLLSPGAVFVAWLVTLVPYGIYCRIRPVGGMDCFLAFAGPVWSAWVLYLISGLPQRELAALLLAISLIALIAIDREDRDLIHARH